MRRLWPYEMDCLRVLYTLRYLTSEQIYLNWYSEEGVKRASFRVRLSRLSKDGIVVKQGYGDRQWAWRVGSEGCKILQRHTGEDHEFRRPNASSVLEHQISVNDLWIRFGLEGLRKTFGWNLVGKGFEYRKGSRWHRLVPDAIIDVKGGPRLCVELDMGTASIGSKRSSSSIINKLEAYNTGGSEALRHFGERGIHGVHNKELTPRQWYVLFVVNSPQAHKRINSINKLTFSSYHYEGKECCTFDDFIPFVIERFAPKKAERVTSLGKVSRKVIKEYYKVTSSFMKNDKSAEAHALELKSFSAIGIPQFHNLLGHYHFVRPYVRDSIYHNGGRDLLIWNNYKALLSRLNLLFGSKALKKPFEVSLKAFEHAMRDVEDRG